MNAKILFKWTFSTILYVVLTIVFYRLLDTTPLEVNGKLVMIGIWLALYGAVQSVSNKQTEIELAQLQGVLVVGISAVFVAARLDELVLPVNGWTHYHTIGLFCVAAIVILIIMLGRDSKKPLRMWVKIFWQVSLFFLLQQVWIYWGKTLYVLAPIILIASQAALLLINESLFEDPKRKDDGVALVVLLVSIPLGGASVFWQLRNNPSILQLPMWQSAIGLTVLAFVVSLFLSNKSLSKNRKHS